MLFFFGFLVFQVWLLTVYFRWPVHMLELLVGWLFLAIGNELFDRRYPPCNFCAVFRRQIMFILICCAGLTLVFYNL